MKQPEDSPAVTHTQRVDDPEALAKHAIKLLERHLRDTYHLKVQMGVELEYTMILKPDAPALMNSPSAITDPLRLGQYDEEPKPRMFKLSRFAAYSYPEGHGARNTSKSCFQYETVSDHEHPMPLQLLPNAINQLRKELVSGGDKMLNADGILNEPPATTKITKWNITHPRRIHQAKWYDRNVAEVRFDSQNEDNPKSAIFNGLHLNFSLRDYRKSEESEKWELGKPILKSMDPLMISLVDTTNRYFTEEEYLFNQTPEQAFRAGERRTKKAYPMVTIRNTDMEDKATPAPKGMPCYLENKTPPADANNYYAVMLQLAAIADAVGQSHGHTASNLEGVLNALESGLGARFKHAERAHPELRSYHTMPAVNACIGKD